MVVLMKRALTCYILPVRKGLQTQQEDKLIMRCTLNNKSRPPVLGAPRITIFSRWWILNYQIIQINRKQFKLTFSNRP